jgi:asparagine N-glycosylation enzyme membrane subunit Stt3
MSIILFLMYRLLLELDAGARNMLIGTAIIIFVFRATPLTGPGLAWFEIDELGFDQQFLSVLSLIGAALTLVGMFVLRPMMGKHSIAFVIVILTIAAGLLSLPNIGLYYGIHDWTAAHTGGVVDARFIAIIDTALESPLGQIAMIPMLAWIAQNAPAHLKATFFAVMASFTNLALSASSLGTRYVNEIYQVTREVRDRVTDVIESTADYSELGMLLISVTLFGFCAPLLTVFLIQRSRLRTHQ